MSAYNVKDPNSAHKGEGKSKDQGIKEVKDTEVLKQLQEQQEQD